jgi:hypothetical protein
VLLEGIGGALELRFVAAVSDTKLAEEPGHDIRARVLGEFRIVGEVELLGDPQRQVARGEHLHLALDRLLVEGLDLVAPLIGRGTGEG